MKEDHNPGRDWLQVFIMFIGSVVIIACVGGELPMETYRGETTFTTYSAFVLGIMIVVWLIICVKVFGFLDG